MKIRWSINEGRKAMRKLLWLISSCVLLALGSMASAQNVPGVKQAFRGDYDGALCAEVSSPYITGYEGRYIGHDEPMLLFYSDVPGSGNNMVYFDAIAKRSSDASA